MHHAYLYEGQQNALEALVASARALLGFTKENDPDVHIYKWEKFTIDEARSLTAEASLKPVSGRALFVLALGSIGHDAQQALLKLFEEPQAGVTFVLLTPPGTLSSTLRSRFVEYPEKVEEVSGGSAAAKKFITSSYKERSTQVTALIKEEEGGKERVREFLTALEVAYHTNLSKSAEARVALGDIALVRNYVADRSASLKMLLEHLAATLPIV